MRLIGLLLFFIYSSVMAEPYVYPKRFDQTLACNSNDVDLKYVREIAFKDVQNTQFENESCEYSHLKIETHDLNDDGLCEYFVTAMVEEQQWTRVCELEYTKIIELNNGEAKTLLSGPNVENHFAEKRNGFLRLVYPSSGGHQTNIIFTTNVFYYDGEKYVCEFCEDNSRGGYMDLAKQAYQQKDFDLAEAYYWNAYAMGFETKLSDANNLALTYIKKGKNDDAISLLNKHLSMSDQEILNAEKTPCNSWDCDLTEAELTKLKSQAKFNLELAIKTR